GTNGSRSMAIAGSALLHSAQAMLAAARRMAGAMLGVDETQIEFSAGRFEGAGKSLGWQELAVASFDEDQRPAGVQPGLHSSAHFEPEAGTFPNGCHVCEVEVDPATGTIDILRYTIEDDVGVVINPLLLEGQVVGGVAQGLGQALTEHAVYDPDGGQLLTATFMDYGMPRADWMPPVDFHYRVVPSPRNPLGVKGAGEAGTVGAAPALVNAVMDAVRSQGIEDLQMPLTPLKIWQSLRDARKTAA
ncbi:MAG: molybdopterin-dependent oxidoreductase, partial [Gammaproteobacteria bacterium]|nr:molybdopterin-dependent oxidoreductase [Gammaproteobacteria bacterium]